MPRRLIIFGVCLAAGLALLWAWWPTGHKSLSSAAPPATVSSTNTVSSTTATSSTTAMATAGQARSDDETRAPTDCPPPNSSPAIATETLVASVRSAGAPGSQTPGGPTTVEVPGRWYGAASVLPVISQQPGWYEVRLAQRPNESTAWVPASDVDVATDSYHIVVDLGCRHVRLFKDGQQIGNFPAGVGVPDDPTPTGRYFVALFAQAPTPAYGAFVIVTSAHSNTISDWEQSGDAITAIHGPLGSDAAIGTTGAQVSHGCVRLHNADLAQLRDVPAGTPIDIVS